MKESVYESRLNVQPLLSRLGHRGKGSHLDQWNRVEERRNRSRQICPTHLKIQLFIYFLAFQVFIAVCGHSLVGSMGQSAVCGVGFSLQWLLLFQSMSSRACGLQKLQHLNFSSCSRWASLVAASGLSSCGSQVH